MDFAIFPYRDGENLSNVKSVTCLYRIKGWKSHFKVKYLILFNDTLFFTKDWDIEALETARDIDIHKEITLIFLPFDLEKWCLSQDTLVISSLHINQLRQVIFIFYEVM